MDKSILFTPGKIGPLTLRNRTIRAAAFESMCPGNAPSEQLFNYHTSVAAGGIGMTNIAYAAVTQSGLSFERQLWMRPDIIPGLRKLTDAIHKEGAVASIPAILWALGMILLGIASDDLSAGLITALLSVIINFPLVVLLILPALLNKTDKKWPIFILSFLLGWTFIGWIILLAVSINTNKEAERIRQQQMMMQMAGQQGSSDTFNPFQ